MVQFSVALSNGVVGSTGNVKFHALSNYDGECQGSTNIRLWSDRKQGYRNTQTQLRHEEYVDIRMKLSPRLWAKPKLTSRKLKKFLVHSALNDFGVFMKKNMKRVVVATSISVALGSCYLLFRLTAIPTPKIVPYSDLVTSLQAGSVTKVLFEEGSRRIYFNNKRGTTSEAPTEEEEVELSPAVVHKENVVDKEDLISDNEKSLVKGMTFSNRNMNKPTRSPVWQFSTRKIDHDEKFLLTLMREKGTTYSSSPQSAMMSVRSILITVLTLWIPLTPLMWLLYRQLNTANNPARKRRPDQQVDTFDDVEGVDSAKTELLEIVMCLQGSISYAKLGAKLPRGVLLIGPPGTGKTLLARAVAGEAGVPFFSVSASEFVELFVGRGAARIRDLFSVARKYSPSIVFIDELDAVGGKRGRSFNDERDQTLNQLLTEMDGFESDSKVIVIAATNRPEALDSALCRPGRFSRKVLVGEPDEEGRRKILGVHLRGVPLDENKELMCSLVASLTQGFVGADLANIVNEAALLAARRGGENVSREDMMQAIERAKFGIIGGEKKAQQNPNALTKELGRLFPWMPPLMMRRNLDEEQGPPMGYQSLS